MKVKKIKVKKNKVEESKGKMSAIIAVSANDYETVFVASMYDTGTFVKCEVYDFPTPSIWDAYIEGLEILSENYKNLTIFTANNVLVDFINSKKVRKDNRHLKRMKKIHSSKMKAGLVDFENEAIKITRRKAIKELRDYVRL